MKQDLDEMMLGLLRLDRYMDERSLGLVWKQDSGLQFIFSSIIEKILPLLN